MIFTTGFKNAYVDAITNLFNVGGGEFEILDSGNNVLGTFTLLNPTFDPAAAGEAVLANPFDVEITVAGTAAKYRAYINGTEFEEGTVGTSGADLIVSKLTYNIGEKIRISTWTKSFPV